MGQILHKRATTKLEIKSKKNSELLIPLPKNTTLTGLPLKNGKVVIALKTSQWETVDPIQT